MLTEGYMFCSEEKNLDVETRVKFLISKMEKDNPEFRFNTCLVSELTLSSGVLTIEGISVVPYKIPRDHFWFILNTEK
jgi:hypothetical protein